MDVLFTCKYEEDLIKNEPTRVLTQLYMDFLDTQGQVTPQSLIKSGWNSNLSKLLWLSSLSAKMKIPLKMKEIEC